jgi:hypothetical protein
MAPAVAYAQAPGSMCSSGLYKDLAGLSAFPAAQSFCNAHYPQARCTSTVAGPVATAKPAKSGVLGSDADLAYLMLQLEILEKDILSTACSCIETQTCVTVRYAKFGAQ